MRHWSDVTYTSSFICQKYLQLADKVHEIGTKSASIAPCSCCDRARHLSRCCLSAT